MITYIVLLLGFVPVAGEVAKTQGSQPNEQFMHQVFFNGGVQQGFAPSSYAPLRSQHLMNPEWNQRRCGNSHSQYSWYQGVGCNCYTNHSGGVHNLSHNQKYASFSFDDRELEMASWLHSPQFDRLNMKFPPEIDRVPTFWKGLRHKCQAIWAGHINDIVAYRIHQFVLDPQWYVLQWNMHLLKYKNSLPINKLSTCKVVRNVLQDRPDPSLANLACECLEKQGDLHRVECGSCNDSEHSLSIPKVSFDFSRLLFTDIPTKIRNEYDRNERISLTRLLSYKTSIRSHDWEQSFDSSNNQWVPALDGVQDIQVSESISSLLHCSCDTQMAHTHVAEPRVISYFQMFNTDIPSFPCILGFKTRFHQKAYCLIKCGVWNNWFIKCYSVNVRNDIPNNIHNHRLRRFFWEEHVIISLFSIFATLVGPTWKLASVTALWFVRAAGQALHEKVVVIPQCRFVGKKRVRAFCRRRHINRLRLSQCSVLSYTRSGCCQNGEWFIEAPHFESTCRWFVHLSKGSCDEIKVLHSSQNEKFSLHLNRKVAYQGVRVGEAKVPGPDSLDIGNFNPTQLFGKEEDVMSWGQGIYCAAETSTTSAAMKVLRPKFAKKNFYTVWSEPVEPVQPRFSQLRGKASGVAIISSFPIRQFHEPTTCAIEDTCRFVDGVVQLSPNCVAYVATIYGPASSSIALDPLAITNQLFNFAAERAVSFKGPAIIAGDFNCHLTDLTCWDCLVSNGWCDAAVLDGALHNREPQPTSKDAVRKSFILLNGLLATTLQQCRTCQDHLFPGHPLLLANCSFPNVISPRLQWVLPKSVDGFMFDSQLLEQAAKKFVDDHTEAFQKAVDTSLDAASNLMAEAVEFAWQHACVDCEGNKCKIPAGYMGRNKLCPLKPKPNSVPVVRKARDGDFEPKLGQPSVEIRRHSRQLRRIESLYAQLVAYNRRPTQGALQKCQQLWSAILGATGFTKSFAFWVCTNFQFFVPLNLPTAGYVLELKDVFRKWHQAELNRFFLYKKKARKKSILLDIAGGGSQCFQEIRDPMPQHQSFVARCINLKVYYTTWTKRGKTNIRVQNANQLEIDFPVTFQEQTRRIVKISGEVVQLDKPVKLKNLDLVITQQQVTADPAKMHDQTFQAWNEHWRRDCSDPNDDDWDGVIPYLQHINPIPDMAVEDFTCDLWEQHLSAVKTKTARGGCGFSAKEMQQFPPSILSWLFQIYRGCEQGKAWPKNWVLARVSMLAKTPNPKTPFDARPITVFSILYRQWARIRSKQILKQMASYMPRSVAMATCRVPADVAACYIATMVEDAINTDRSLAGLGIDLKRCFNTLPRWPLILAMRRMGIPQCYINGWNSMLTSMQRTLWLGSSQSSPQLSTTGAPEGCGFSVVAMAVMSWWQAKAIQTNISAVDTVTYADNWNYIAEGARVIRDTLQELKLFVDCMRMAISPSKSWLWATSPRERKALRGVEINHETIPVVTSFSDLGCDVQYARTQKKPKQKKRWDRTSRLCRRIQFSKTPRKYKEHMVVASGLSGAIFGAPVTYVPKTRWRSLRSNMAQSVRLATAGASPWLALACTFNDPQLKNLGYTLGFWKRFLSMFPAFRDKFANTMLRNGKSQVGPIASLKKTLRDAQWRINTCDEIQHVTTGYKINWMTASKQYLRFVLERQWCHTASQAAEHRKDWHAGTVDFHLYSQITKKRNYRDTWILRTAAAGKHYTNEIISKYTNGVQETCPFCDKRDSKKHRLWVCSAFQDIRAKHMTTLRKVQNKNNNLGLYALPPMQAPIVSCLPSCSNILESTRVPPDDNAFRHLFLDGTAFGQEYKDLTVSAWAVVEAELGVHNFHTIDKNFVPGQDHSSYRGEVVSILRGLENMYRGIMYTDCAAALTIYQKLQQAVKEGQNLPNVDHQDLWSLVWIHLTHRPCGCVNLAKVKSHQVEANIVDPHQLWLAAGNNYVDGEAKSVVVQNTIHRKVVAAVKSRQQLTTLTAAYYDYVCEVADRSFELAKETRRCARLEAESQMERPTFDNLIPPHVQESASITPWEELPRQCPYGEIFYRRFSQWYATVQWPVNPQGGVMGYVSLLELYFNFVVCTGTETPISTARRGQPSCYRLLDQDVLLQTKAWSLSQHTRVWCLFWNWCLKSQVFVEQHLKASNQYLDHVGYSMQSVCLVGRPRLQHSRDTYQSMWNYFHRPEGRRKTTAAPLRPLPTHTATI